MNLFPQFASAFLDQHRQESSIYLWRPGIGPCGRGALCHCPDLHGLLHHRWAQAGTGEATCASLRLIRTCRELIKNMITTYMYYYCCCCCFEKLFLFFLACVIIESEQQASFSCCWYIKTSFGSTAVTNGADIQTGPEAASCPSLCLCFSFSLMSFNRTLPSTSCCMPETSHATNRW